MKVRYNLLKFYFKKNESILIIDYSKIFYNISLAKKIELYSCNIATKKITIR